jgi:hypothetical protein
MRRKIPKYIFLLLATAMVIAVIVAYRIWNEPHLNIKNADAVKISAVALYHSLANKNGQTKKDFANTVVAVTGTVKRVIENRQKQQVILLETNTDGASVNCTMEQNAKNIKEGDTLRLKGMCIGYSGEDTIMNLPGDVFLIRCYPL